ncbi:hypothetical protein GGX14DRAFT_576467 [Mycena pura]|uniref:Uncharacterized protein n=1 Tax=Mycena pura TaxID=153505 RepID=A0AAD6UTK9_9AGAR|nr:hypothetical protein GGX14DRAFT_576467 [Mycena pura]
MFGDQSRGGGEHGKLDFAGLVRHSSASVALGLVCALLYTARVPVVNLDLWVHVWLFMCMFSKSTTALAIVLTRGHTRKHAQVCAAAAGVSAT